MGMSDEDRQKAWKHFFLQMVQAVMQQQGKDALGPKLAKGSRLGTLLCNHGNPKCPERGCVQAVAGAPRAAARASLRPILSRGFLFQLNCGRIGADMSHDSADRAESEAATARRHAHHLFT